MLKLFDSLNKGNELVNNARIFLTIFLKIYSRIGCTQRININYTPLKNHLLRF